MNCCIHKSAWPVLLAALALLVAGVAPAGAAGVDKTLDSYSRPGQLVDIGGRRLNLRCSGHGAPTVILDIGLGETSLAWRKVQPAIARMTRVCSYDRAGFAFSDAGPLPRDGRAEADDLHALVRAAKLRTPLVLVGHSLGSVIARIYANLHRDEVAGIVVVDYPAYDFDLHEPAADALQNRMNREDLQYGPYRACAEAARAGLLDPAGKTSSKACKGIPPKPPEFSDKLYASVRANMAKPRYWQALIAEKESWVGATPAGLRATQRSYGALPLTILAADGSNAYLPADLRKMMDDAWAASYRRLAALSTRSRIVTVTHSSHLMYLDRPDAIVDAVRDMLGEVRRRRSGK